MPALSNPIIRDTPGTDGATVSAWDDLTREDLQEMAAAGQRILECYRILQKTGDNVVGEILRGQGEFLEWDHYPTGDVYDHETHSQYYYHAHPTGERLEEHGHFHTFLRARGMPPGIVPAALPDYAPPKNDNDALSHIVAISMDRAGYPIRLFTVNRWVTGDTWYAASNVISMIDRFAMELAHPSWLSNAWITDMLHLFKPDIVDLLRKRDAAVSAWQRAHPCINAYEDRDLEVLSLAEISVDKQFKKVVRALRQTAPDDPSGVA